MAAAEAMALQGKNETQRAHNSKRIDNKTIHWEVPKPRHMSTKNSPLFNCHPCFLKFMDGTLDRAKCVCGYDDKYTNQPDTPTEEPTDNSKGLHAAEKSKRPGTTERTKLAEKSGTEHTDVQEKMSPLDEAKSQLARLNGQVNRMTRDQLETRLKELKLDLEGSRDVLKKRLKTYYKEQKLAGLEVEENACGGGEIVKPSGKIYDYYIVIDFEATCDANNRTNFMHEIIEFPAVLVSTAEMRIVGEFHRYCQPSVEPKLSQFCRELTGISQHRVDQAQSFPTVLTRFKQWLAQRGIGTTHTYVVVTDGPWDMGRFLRLQCQTSGIEYPSFAKEWVNVRKTFAYFYNSRKVSTMYPLRTMLQLLGLGFEGRPHCGLHDARNIGRIVIRLLKDGANLRANERMDFSRSGSAAPHCLPVVPISSEEFKKRAKAKKPRALQVLEDPEQNGEEGIVETS